MATFKDRVEALIGSITGVTDSAPLDDYLTGGARFLIEKIPPDRLEAYATVTSKSAGQTHSVLNRRKLRVTVGSREAPQASPGDLAQLADTGSLYYQSSYSPRHVISDGVIRVYPSSSGYVVYDIPYATVVRTQTETDHPKFPQLFFQAMILYAAMMAYYAHIRARLSAGLSDVTWSSPTLPTAPSAPSFSYTAVDPTSVLYTVPDIDFALSLDTEIAGITSLSTYFDTDWAALKAELTSQLDDSDDIELGMAKVKEIETYLLRFKTSTEQAVAKFGAAYQNWQALLQKSIRAVELKAQEYGEEAKLQTEIKLQNAAKALEGDMMLYKMQLEKYGTEMQGYVANSQAEANRVTSLIQKGQIEQQSLLQTWNSLRSLFISELQLLGVIQEAKA